MTNSYIDVSFSFSFLLFFLSFPPPHSYTSYIYIYAHTYHLCCSGNHGLRRDTIYNQSDISSRRQLKRGNTVTSYYTYEFWDTTTLSRLEYHLRGAPKIALFTSGKNGLSLPCAPKVQLVEFFSFFFFLSFFDGDLSCLAQQFHTKLDFSERKEIRSDIVYVSLNNFIFSHTIIHCFVNEDYERREQYSIYRENE